MVSPILIIEAVAFVDLLGIGLFLPLLMIHARKVGGSHIQIGLLRSVYSIFQLGSGPLIGSLSDLKGTKIILIITLLLSSVGYILMGYTSSIYVLLSLRGALGLVKQTQMLTKAMVADYERDKHKQGLIFGRLIAVAGTGMTLGPVIGGYVEETYPDSGYFIVSITVGMCFLCNAGLIWMLPDPVRRPTRSRTHMKQNVIQIFFRSIQLSFVALYDLDWSLYGDIFIFKGLIGFANGIYFAIYAALLKEQYLLTPKYIGSIISFQNIVGSLSCYFICVINSLYVGDDNYSTRNFHIFIVLSAAYFGLIFATNVVLYIVWLIPLAIANSVSRIVTFEMILNRSHGAHRGKLIGAVNSVASLSGIISPVVAGIIGEWLGVKYVIYASLLATSLGLLLSFYKIYNNTFDVEYD